MLGIEHPHIADQDRSGQVVRNSRGYFVQPRTLGLDLQAFELCALPLATLFDDPQETGNDESEELRVRLGRQPDEIRVRVDTDDGVQADRFGPLAILHRTVEHLADRELASRESCDPAL